MKLLKIISIVLLVGLFAETAFASGPIAIVLKARGPVTIKNARTGKLAKARRGSRLRNGDKIKTGRRGRVAIKFIDDASLVRIRPNSSCTINAKKEKNSVAKNVFVEVGTIFSRITKQRSRFRVTTPTSVASVKGTQFWTVQKFNGGTLYFGEEGVVEISNDAGVALMKAGETSEVSSKNSKPIVRKTKKGEKPGFESEGDAPDEFEFDFEDAKGNPRVLKFKVNKSK